MQYSPLCDTDIVAYREYLWVNVLDHHGVALVDSVRECWGSGARSVGGGCTDVIVSALADVASSVSQRSQGVDVVSADGGDVGVHSFAGGVVGGARVVGCGEVASVSGGGVSDDKCSVAGGFVFSKCGQVADPVGGLPLGGVKEDVAVPLVSEKTMANKLRRKVRQEKKKARQAGMQRDNWRAMQVVPEELRESWIERKKAENLAATKRFEREVEVLASQDVEKIKKRTNAKLDASLKLVEGQVAGKYSLVAPKHVIGYCETVGTATSSSGSSGATKSAWSGSGASKFSRNSSETSREKELEDEIAILKREVAEVKKSAQKNVDEQLKRDLKNACYYLARGGNDAYESFLTIKGKKVLAGFQGNY